MIPAAEALDRLREGNLRFLAGARDLDPAHAARRRAELVAGQRPFAAILACSDSRVPVELLFDQGFGDLFVVRVAGNVAGPSQIGSIEYAASHLGTRLVVVLGHSRCGAILATLEALRSPAGVASPNLRSIVEEIRPAVLPLPPAAPGRDTEELVRRAVRANVRAAVARLREGSEVLARAMREDGLLVVGAEYSIETGAVEYPGEPATGA